ncbi:MAG: DUF4202 domain-containing protein [Terriglobia bacterium]
MQKQRFDQAVQAFESVNGQDPHRIRIQGQEIPKELWYARELERWILTLQPLASEVLRLAAHCQHLERWKIPRQDFPPGRIGYLSWRKKLAQFHASRAEEILRAVGYPDTVIQRVKELNLKQDIKHDPETQTLEDALCLVFLQSQLAEFSEKTEPAKLIDILYKTWKKMSPKGRELALQLNLDPSSRKLVEEAISLQ